MEQNANGMDETLKRWDEWTKGFFSKIHDIVKPRIDRISEEEWKRDSKATFGLIRNKKQAELTQITKAEPDIETWLNQDYKEQDIIRELGKLAKRNEHGNDGIPGEAYKATGQWAIKPIKNIANLMKNGTTIPEIWTEGTIVYIYKNKGDAGNAETTERYVSRR